MKIKELLKQRRTISCEFFPPRAADAIPAVYRTAERLKSYNLDFVSVTYGAGGSTRAFTREITCHLKQAGDVEVMAHLTCVGQTRQEIHAVLEQHAAAGIENVIALRGDPPRGENEFKPVEGGFAHANCLIKHIKANFPGFGVAAACYPEGHIESSNLETDFKHVKRKVEQGADFLITQMFYDNADYYRLAERAQKTGVAVPIVAGVLPVLSAGQIRRFTAQCGVKIPPALETLLIKHAEDDRAMRDAGVEYATRQVEELWANGVPGLHFYVLNRSYSVSRILDNLKLPGHVSQQSATDE